MLNFFFEKLASRLKSENDLSDITWAMAHTSSKFTTAFIQFFFKDIIPVEKSSSIFIEREWSKDNSRPDFYFTYEDNHFLIENKIYDREQHFEEYVKVFDIPNNHLGYITNYPLKMEGFTVHTWREFYNYISKLIPDDESDLWNAYLSYLKKCCNLNISTTPMKLKETYSLFTLYHSIEDIVSFSNEYFQTVVADNAFNKGWFSNRAGGNFKGGPTDGIMGKYFHVSFKDSSIEETYGWFGVYFNFEEPVICIAFFNFEGCGWPVYKRLFPLYINQKMPEGNLCSDPYLEEQDDSRSTVDAFFFDFLPPEDFENTTLEEQKEVLRKFFSEVMTKIALSEPLEDENTLTTAPADSSISGEEESMENY
ncbi:MAG: PD-(D/E)XK nuclease family protein [Muribaculaceae bacterium]|nr:PD-(D/E)XK nuclease family protein [Muribaculaceae bacterium]MDE6754449.1 PD-(D/E)XK nuclease family protein [Muribaculaceae bacterium]